jgi:catechol 2,3-dioxygenase-like lactoylglutathione lyase family enzyme
LTTIEGFDIVGFSHIGLAVESIEAFVAAWGKPLRLGDWKIHSDQVNPGDIQLHGQPVGFSVRVAFARLGGTSIELVETTIGQTHHGEHVKQRGSGLHHVAFWVRDLPDEVLKASRLNLEVVMSPPSLRPALGPQPVSAVINDAKSIVGVPPVWAFLQDADRTSTFVLELLNAKFAREYEQQFGLGPYYPGDLPDA